MNDTLRLKAPSDRTQSSFTNVSETPGPSFFLGHLRNYDLWDGGYYLHTGDCLAYLHASRGCHFGLLEAQLQEEGLQQQVIAL